MGAYGYLAYTVCACLAMLGGISFQIFILVNPVCWTHDWASSCWHGPAAWFVAHVVRKGSAVLQSKGRRTCPGLRHPAPQSCSLAAVQVPHHCCSQLKLLQSAVVRTMLLAAHPAPVQANAAAAAHGRRPLSSARASHNPKLCVPCRGSCLASSGGHLRTSLAGLQLQWQAQVGATLPAAPVCIPCCGSSSASASVDTIQALPSGPKCSFRGFYMLLTDRPRGPDQHLLQRSQFAKIKAHAVEPSTCSERGRGCRGKAWGVRMDLRTRRVIPAKVELPSLLQVGRSALALLAAPQ